MTDCGVSHREAVLLWDAILDTVPLGGGICSICGHIWSADTAFHCPCTIANPLDA